MKEIHAIPSPSLCAILANSRATLPNILHEYDNCLISKHCRLNKISTCTAVVPFPVSLPDNLLPGRKSQIYNSMIATNNP